MSDERQSSKSGGTQRLSCGQEPVGYVDEFGNVEKTMQPWMREEPNVTWTPLYFAAPNVAQLSLSEGTLQSRERTIEWQTAQLAELQAKLEVVREALTQEYLSNFDKIKAALRLIEGE